jgi:hypothetical protein
MVDAVMTLAESLPLARSEEGDDVSVLRNRLEGVVRSLETFLPDEVDDRFAAAVEVIRYSEAGDVGTLEAEVRSALLPRPVAGCYHMRLTGRIGFRPLLPGLGCILTVEVEFGGSLRHVIAREAHVRRLRALVGVTPFLLPAPFGMMSLADTASADLSSLFRVDEDHAGEILRRWNQSVQAMRLSPQDAGCGAAVPCAA